MYVLAIGVSAYEKVPAGLSARENRTDQRKDIVVVERKSALDCGAVPLVELRPGNENSGSSLEGHSKILYSGVCLAPRLVSAYLNAK